MTNWSTLALAVTAAVVLYGLARAFYATVIQPYFSELRQLPGPPSPSFLFGNFRQIWNADNSVLHEEWVEEYGNTLQYKGMFNVRKP